MVDKVSFSIFEVEILLKIKERFYGISSVAYHADYIFQELIPYYQAFYIKEMKLALLRLYIINPGFPASNIL